MISEPRAKPITADDFEKFDPEWRYDLIRGELFPMPPFSSEQHGFVTSDLSLELTLYVKRNNQGRTFAAGTRFVIEQNPDTALAPGWAFIARERAPKIPSEKFSRIVPDAILEVRSPSDRGSEVVKKMNRWIAAGVRIGSELNPMDCGGRPHRVGTEPKKENHDGVPPERSGAAD